jgi:hypothetical protein
MSRYIHVEYGGTKIKKFWNETLIQREQGYHDGTNQFLTWNKMIEYGGGGGGIGTVEQNLTAPGTQLLRRNKSYLNMDQSCRIWKKI